MAKVAVGGVVSKPEGRLEEAMVDKDHFVIVFADVVDEMVEGNARVAADE